MEQAKIDRINALAQKAKTPAGLTPEETAERAALQGLFDLGLSDSFRLFETEGGQFSWWDYRAAGFRRNLGLRIDLVLASEALKPRLTAAGIDREPRTWERPSDHAPVWLELAATP